MNHRDWMGFSRTAVAVAVAVVAAAPALAQNTTAAVSGRITGADGAPVAGATISVLHVESGSTSTLTTDADGRYAARGLRAGGPYVITVTKGSETDRREGVTLALAETLNLDVQLGGASQTIVVTGRGVSDKFNRNAMGAGTNIGSRELAAQASISRNLQDYARLDPRLSQTDKANGSISAAGQNNRFNSVTIDGVTTSDTFGLEANNLPTKKQPISIDAIQSVQVNVSNYDVTQKGYTGANINAVTKSGTNEFHGSVYYVGRNEHLVGKFYNKTADTYSEFAPFKESTKGFTLGGPILQDKLFFFGSYEEFKSTKAAPTYGPVGSNLTNVGISPGAIDSAINIARDRWGIDIGTAAVPSSVELVVKDTLLKLDWNISDNHRANLRYSKTQQSDPVITNFFSPTQLSLSSYWYVTDKTIETLVGQLFSDWTTNFSTELKVSQRDYTQRHTPINGTRLPQVGLFFPGALPTGAPAGTATNSRFLNFGTEASRQLNVLDTKTSDLYLGGTYNLGAHELKFGADYSNNEIYNAFLQNVNGAYTFGCESTATTGATYTFGSINCATAPAAQVEAASLENFQRGRPSSYTVQLPQAGRTLQDGVANFKLSTTGLFLQDSWKLNDKVSLMFGVRIDEQGVNTKPIFNARAAAAPVSGSVSTGATPTYTRASGGFGIDNSTTVDGQTVAQPRFGFNWNLGTNERRMQLRGGLGLFQGAAASVWLSNPFSNTGMAVAQYNCASYTACNTAPVNAVFNPNPDTQSLSGTVPAPAVDAISPDLKQPSVWKANLAFDMELPALPGVGTLVAGAEWLHTKTKDAIYYQNLNLGNPTRLGPDGRELYYRAEGLSSNCYTVGTTFNVTNVTSGGCATPNGQSRTRALSNPNFANVIVANGTSKGGGDSLTLSLSKPATQGLSWGVAYTYTEAKEVSPLTSSTSNSNWNGRNIFNPNEEVLQNSNYMIRDRVTANMAWSQAFFSTYRTSVGVFYEGRRGKPYSWTYINDLNGDAIAGNDLMYIPRAPGSGEVAFAPVLNGTTVVRSAAETEALFWQVVNNNKGLTNARGGVVGRNSNYAPWVNNIDLRLSQEVPGFTKSHKASFTLDFLNFGNLLNKRWGHINEIDFPSRRSFVNYAGLDAQGRYVYSVNTTNTNADFITRQSERESQWAIQATLRYEF